MNEVHNLGRFREAQQDVYPIALEELRGGRKMSHWMWYIFPQLKELGRKRRAHFYGITGTAEAEAYLADSVLGPRLREVSEAILRLSTNDAREVFGTIDSCKLQSSMTLFDIVSPDDIFSRVLDKYFSGRRDEVTVAISRGETLVPDNE